MTPERVRGTMIRLYGEMPRLYAPEYRAIFQKLLGGRTPLLLHCTAGKDRSGVAAALILAALGVPEQTIVEDYVLTNGLLRQDAPASGPMAAMHAMAPDVRAALLRADPAYLQAAFRGIDAEYGSFDRYLADQLGVTAIGRQALRARLLE